MRDSDDRREAGDTTVHAADGDSVGASDSAPAKKRRRRRRKPAGAAPTPTGDTG
jgi:hypothetical protein